MSQNPLPPSADDPPAVPIPSPDPAPDPVSRPTAEVRRPGPPPVRRVVRRTAPVAVGLPEGTTYLGAWPRLAASIIDSILILALVAPLIMLLKGSGAGGIFEPYIEQYTFLQKVFSVVGADPNNVSMDSLPPIPQPPSPMELLIKIGIPAGAFLIFWRYRSATPGKMIFRARIVDAATLGPPSNGQLVIRYLGYYLGVLTCMLGFVTILFDSRRQGIHDKLANTVVISP